MAACSAVSPSSIRPAGSSMTVLPTGGRYCFWRTISGPARACWSVETREVGRGCDTYPSPFRGWRQSPRHRYRCPWVGCASQQTPMFALRPWGQCRSSWVTSGLHSGRGLATASLTSPALSTPLPSRTASKERLVSRLSLLGDSGCDSDRDLGCSLTRGSTDMSLDSV